MRAAIVLVGLLTAFSGAVQAECVCRCVNGEVKAICRSTLDIAPICAPTICPIVPPSIAPIPAPTVPPIGTKQCRPEQVYNPITRQYEWKSICK
jgi:hypothetical protein